LRFQFGAIRGGNGWDSFGNLLDDIKFTPFLACPATRSLSVGETETVDVSNLSYGIDQTLEIIGNASSSAAQFSKSGDRISFTPTSAGTYTIDYQMAMDFAGQTYTTASRITYNVTGSSDSDELASTGTTSGAQALGGMALVLTGALLLTFRRRTTVGK
jgi:LPXTG-motif cell wall-anchored protein